MSIATQAADVASRNQTVATDMYSGQTVVRPVANPRLRYDFDFTKDGIWFYVNSFDDLENPHLPGQIQPVVEKGEKWRIVDAATGNIVKTNA